MTWSIKNKKAIWYVLFLAAVLRILLPIIAYIRNKNFSIFYSIDSDKYISLAKTLLEKRAFVYNGLPEIERTPGYPIFLMPGIKLDQPEIVTTIIQIVLSCLTVFLVFKVSLLIFKKYEIAILSSLLYALEPLSILYSSKLLPETLFTTLIVLSIYSLTKYFNDKKLIDLATSSIALAISAYIRPNSILLGAIIAIILFLYFYTCKQRNVSQIVASFLFILIFTFITGVWHMRNLSVANYNGFSAIGDRAIYELSVECHVCNYEAKNQRLGREKRKEFFLINYPEKRIEMYKFLRDEGSKMILNNPLMYFLMHLKGMSMFLLNPGLTEFLRMFNFNYPEVLKIIQTYFDVGLSAVLCKILKEIPIIFLLFVFSSLIVLIYFLLALIPLTSRKLFTVQFISIISVMIYLFVIASYEAGRSRYRQPIMPLVSVLSGYGLWVSANKLKSKSK